MSISNEETVNQGFLSHNDPKTDIMFDMLSEKSTVNNAEHQLAALKEKKRAALQKAADDETIFRRRANEKHETESERNKIEIEEINTESEIKIQTINAETAFQINRINLEINKINLEALMKIQKINVSKENQLLNMKSKLKEATLVRDKSLQDAQRNLNDVRLAWENNPEIKRLEGLCGNLNVNNQDNHAEGEENIGD